MSTPPATLDIAGARASLEESGLLRRLHEVWETINREAGARVLEEVDYLGSSCVRRYCFQKGNMKYVMQVSVAVDGPLLTFFAYHPDDGTGYYSGYYKRLRQKIVHREQRLRVPLTPEGAGDTDLQQWFSYLLSGFKLNVAANGVPS